MNKVIEATNGTTKTRTARNPESITKGALALELKDRVELLKSLKISIQNEVPGKEAEAKNAAELVNGL